MDNTIIQTQFPFADQNLERAKELFLKWLEILEQYANGYSKELIVKGIPHITQFLSHSGNQLDKHFSEILETKIPKESLILVHNFLLTFGSGYNAFVLAEGSRFEQTTFHDELSIQLAGMSPPRDTLTSNLINNLKAHIRTHDIVIIYYERGQYDNVLSWPLLLHEAFHSIYPSFEIKEVTECFSKISWLEEALVDIFITHYFGPAYAVALASHLYRYPSVRASTHPSLPARLAITLQYLQDVINIKDELPIAMSNNITDIFDYVNRVWDEYRGHQPEIQETAIKIYRDATKGVISRILRKTNTFIDHLKRVENEKLRNLNPANNIYPQNEVLSVDDVLNYYSYSIPVAADPRILFNAFASKRFFNEQINQDFIAQSLKKWHLKQAWLESKGSA